MVYVQPERSPGEPPPEPARVEIRQQNARFSSEFTVVAQDQKVLMPNDDDIDHNVYSASGPNRFDLGIYEAGQVRSVRFRHPGPVDVHCSIHESMNATIFVAPSLWLAPVSADGTFSIGGLEPGRYRLRTWSQRLSQAEMILRVRPGQTVPATVVIRAPSPGERPHPAARSRLAVLRGRRNGRYEGPMRPSDSFLPMIRSAVLMLGVFAVGTVGYRALGGSDYSWVDALYMTTITLTTVGYGETIPVAGRPGAQLFTVLLLLTGAGTFVYFFSQLTAFLVGGTLQDIFRRRHMERWIARLDAHHVVCGAGHSGQVVVKELLATDRPVVVVDADAERADALVASLGQEVPIVIGDATEDEVLTRAGVKRARSLVTCIGSDKDNILVVFAARNLNPRLRIVARSREVEHQSKLRRAGADAIVSPEQIGGLRLVSETIRPTVVSFLDLMLRDTEHNWRVEQVTVAPGSSVDGSTVDAVRALGFDVLLMALRRTDGQWVFNPKGSHPLPAGTDMVFLGSPGGREALEAAAHA